MTPAELRTKFTLENDDVGMIEHPECWPNKICLPVKTYKNVEVGAFPRVGIILNPKEYPSFAFIVFETNMLAPEWETCPKFKFESAADIVAAGWLVD